MKRLSLRYLNNILRALFKLRKLESSSLFFFDPKEYEIISVQRNKIPKNSKLVECYETEDGFIIYGHPYSDKDHNCTNMGCVENRHILYKFTKE